MGSSRPRGQTSVLCIARQTLNHWATREAPIFHLYLLLPGIIIAAVLVHLDYYKKVPWTGRLVNNRNSLLMVLEVGFS